MAATAAGTRRVRPGNTVAPGWQAAAAYRADLDGLRGVAIALVVVFHVWFGRVSGGVDVFLVLSGFFFTGLLLRGAEGTGSVGVWFTLRRTARRLLPAMVVVLAAVVIATVTLRPYTQWSYVADQTLASLFYYQNWQLASTWSDYLAADPSVSPLQHLWSMAVQGQFYLVALIAVAAVAWLSRLAGRPALLRPVLGVVVTGVLVVSFGYAVEGAATHQGWNYYDSFARAWELLAGAGIALAAAYLSPPRVLRAVLAWAGTAGVVLCGWLILDGANRFPGPYALLPVVAAVAVIVSGNNALPGDRPWPNRILSGRVARRLGDLAYPLYLWHWPILIFYLAESGRPHAGLTDGLAVIAVSMVLAWITQRWVEEPLRMRSGAVRAPGRSTLLRRTSGVLVCATAVAVIASAIGWQISLSHVKPPAAIGELNPFLYPGADALFSGVPVPETQMRPTVLEAPNDVPPPTVDGCIADWDTRDVVTCSYGDQTATRTLALVGSSHAEHWLPALQVLAERRSFRIQVYLKMGCPLTLSDDVTYKGEPIPDCRDWSREVIDRLGADRPDWIFTTGTRPREDIGDETPQDYLDVWAALGERGLNVVAVRDTPWLRRDGVRYAAPDCLANGRTGRGCGMPRDDALDPVDPELEPAARFPNVFPIDMTDAVCEPDVCAVVEGNIMIYHDEHHLTASYSRSLAGPLDQRLQPILGWW
ncbi:peptidoglycan/LPS O-acetylase OafA/YrhL [Nocardia transvalensis]|uniref:Peptidoglycan/LPS O-acetylase OafA/YrhL n=1 Tax=Nocardia transvalensis TaxID=37333 RepID=A0A7W9PA59_9NOCA|nr:acyltransferase family protein [Nocardia transvalensis]MBB5911939.1 peptidoglycan/LPS O-acetylase OafA/YrhL [Nocardia transvalensis]